MDTFTAAQPAVLHVCAAVGAQSLTFSVELPGPTDPDNALATVAIAAAESLGLDAGEITIDAQDERIEGVAGER